MENVRNVVLIIADAVRYDIGAQHLQGLGPTYKTIAPSLHTAPSVASILTGKNVPTHGVDGFGKSLSSDIFTIFDIPNLETAADNRSSMNDTIEWIVPDIQRRQLEQMDPPFMWVTRMPGGHAPYHGFDLDTFDFEDETGAEYISNNAGNIEKLNSDYRAAVGDSLEVFSRIRDQIRKMGELDKTLFVFTSDHGEVLGEYEYIGHNHIGCPELVYVPTTLVYEGISIDCENTLISSVDILPTIVDIMDLRIDSNPFDGESFFNGSSRTYGYNHYVTHSYNNKYLGSLNRIVQSVWEESGGHVFNKTTKLQAVLLFLGLLLQSPKGQHFRKQRSFSSVYKRLQPGHEKFGDPDLTEKEAWSIVQAYNERSSESMKDLESNQRKKLEDLGYL